MSDELIFACVLYAKCWPCQFNQCPGGVHDWADAEDIEHALATGQESPAGKLCGCPCARGPVLEQEPDEPDWDVISLNGQPCTVCGESGACGYDAEGRALIHVTEEADDE